MPAISRHLPNASIPAPASMARMRCTNCTAANNRKDPPWETLYMFDHKGKPDLVMAGRVQGVILQMRASGYIPPDCKIHCCVDRAQYPSNIKSFHTSLTDTHREAARKPAATPGQKGFRTAAPV